MADFPPNLDDGELWVPSEILRRERYYPEFPSELTYMEELAQQLSAYALLERKQKQIRPTKPPPPPCLLLPPNLELRRPNRFHGSMVPPQPGSGLGFHHHHGAGCGGGHHDLYLLENGGSHLGGSRPVFQCRATKPVHNTTQQVESLVRARAAILQRQHQLQNRGQNRLLPPVQASRAWVGGFGRESGGTGVFLPRVAAATHNDASARKKQNVRNGDETKLRGGGGLVKKAGVGRKDQVPAAAAAAEMGLPSDWTY